MEALTVKEYSDLVGFVQTYHKFAGYVSKYDFAEVQKVYPNMPRGLGIKYIDCCYDSRDGKIWSVSFRGFTNIRFSSNQFAGIAPSVVKPKGFNYKRLFDLIFDYLIGEFEPTKDFYFDPREYQKDSREKETAFYLAHGNNQRLFVAPHPDYPVTGAPEFTRIEEPENARKFDTWFEAFEYTKELPHFKFNVISNLFIEQMLSAKSDKD